MTSDQGPADQTQTSTSSRGGSRGNRRGRGTRGRGQTDAASRGGRNAISSASPRTEDPRNESQSNQRAASSKAGRSKRGSRPTERGAAQHRAPRPAAGRSFGGHLTSDHDDAASTTASLSGDAPEFVPGQPIVKRSKPKPQAKKAAQPKLPKSTAADLGARIHEDINNFNYECAICTDEVLRSSQVWSCTLCWTVIHIKCARRWHDNQKKQFQQDRTPQPQGDFSWRCPGCNSKLIDEPGSYHCWCGKDINPHPSSAALPPHSCGQTCAKPRGTCPHPCDLQCHAGPCPPCGLMGPSQSCFCGKNTSHKLCRETDYENGWSCQEICGDLLPCGDHECAKPCHSGLCGDCELLVQATCYCGRVEKMMPCSDQEDPESSYSTSSGEWFDGTFNCQEFCQRKFDCGHHKCSLACHPQDEDAAHCPFSPDVVSSCPCGKTPLDELRDTPRSSCEDPIPHCEQPCGKVLRCGHTCREKCHVGDCGFCTQTVGIPCRCGRTSSESICHQGDVQHPLCFRTCQANLSCGRHKCGEHCCPGEKKAAERQAARKKNKLPSQIPAVEAEHICIKTCGRALKCGSHNCQQICHRGPCGTCPEAIFQEISCNCGRTVLQPPQPCGTLVPECRFNCQRQPACGHPAVDHNCHLDDGSCPKCPFLVDKWCACGKEKLHSQPCHLQVSHCGRPCGKKLKCGLHNCRQLCHRPGECEDVNSTEKHCEQTCGKTKLFCEHRCQSPCHGQTPCNETSPCTSKSVVSCPCGLRQQEVKCQASSSNPTPTHLELKCDDECLRMDRNRRLAAALNIDPATHTNDHVPYSDATLSLFKDNTAWAETQEREFRVFAKSPNEVRLRYKPMAASHRQFLHVLAEDYGLESRSEDVEPDRYVVVYKSTRFVSAPNKTLSQCVNIRAEQAAQAAAAAAAAKAEKAAFVAPSDPFNAFLLTSLRFGLTIDDVNAGLGTDLASQSSLHFNVQFLPSDEILIRATAHYSSFLSPTATEQALATLKPRLAETMKRLELAGNIMLCHVDAEGHVSRREGLSLSDTSGWSAVAGRAAARKDTAALAEELPAKGTGKRLMLGLKKKRPPVEKESSWKALDGDVEC